MPCAYTRGLLYKGAEPLGTLAVLITRKYRRCDLCAEELSHCQNNIFAVMSTRVTPGYPEVIRHLTRGTNATVSLVVVRGPCSHNLFAASRILRDWIHE